jgi:hypothetical protein
MDDAIAIDEAANDFISPRCRVENFFRMKDSAGDVGVGVVERDTPCGKTIGQDSEDKQIDKR